jgi:hypothetical protein
MVALGNIATLPAGKQAAIDAGASSVISAAITAHKASLKSGPDALAALQ